MRTVTTSVHPATLLRRLGAIVYDTLLLVGILIIVTMFVLVFRQGETVEPGTLWFDALIVFVVFAFYGWFWTHGGQTLGMRAWRLKIVREDGADLNWGRALLRFACGWLSIATLGLGFLMSLVDRQRRTLHDWLSSTRLVHLKKAE